MSQDSYVIRSKHVNKIAWLDHILTTTAQLLCSGISVFGRRNFCNLILMKSGLCHVVAGY